MGWMLGESGSKVRCLTHLHVSTRKGKLKFWCIVSYESFHLKPTCSVYNKNQRTMFHKIWSERWVSSVWSSVSAHPWLLSHTQLKNLASKTDICHKVFTDSQFPAPFFTTFMSYGNPRFVFHPPKHQGQCFNTWTQKDWGKELAALYHIHELTDTHSWQISLQQKEALRLSKANFQLKKKEWLCMRA